MPDNQNIHCSRLAEAFLVSAEHLESNKTILDNLNVFPVPDGDTGSNMAGSFVPGVQLLSNIKITSYTQIAEIILPYLNNNSRGNSGFILARFFKGFFSISDSSIDCENLTIEQVASGFSKGFYEVNFSLFNPLAGTMVTIIETMAESLNRQKDYSVIKGLEEAIKEARATLFETPKMLPLLAQAGVIDSGALGFILIFEGLFFGLTGIAPPKELEHNYRFTPDPNAIDTNRKNEEDNQFCTEITVIKTKASPIMQLQDFLKTMGNSIAFVDDPDQIKLHIHTNNPDLIIEELAKYGKISRKKIEDMHSQISSAGSSIDNSTENCIILFSPGSGFSTIFRELGIQHIIQYSNKLPSAGEITDVLLQIDYQNIIILPNNNNILPSCMAAMEKSDKNIAIIPTTNIIQGMTTVYGYSENENLETNIKSMKECQNMAIGLYLFKSADDRIFGQTALKKNDYFVLQNNTVCSVANIFSDAIETALSGIDIGEVGNVTFFYRNQDLLIQLQEVKSTLNAEHPQLEIEIYFGGQSQAELIVMLE